MKPVVGFDTETWLIRPGLLTPRLVCGSFTESPDRGQALLLNREDSIHYFRNLLDTKREIVGHNVAYDLAVFCAAEPSLIGPVFDAVDSGRVHDTQLRQMIIDNANGQLMFTTNGDGKVVKSAFSLQALVMRHLGVYIPKGADTYRLRYHELDGLPFTEWPDEAKEYAEKDAEFTLGVYQKQQENADLLQSEHTEVQAAWALHLASCWGMRTDKRTVDAFKDTNQQAYAEKVEQAKFHGFIREDGTKDMAEIKGAVNAVFEGKAKTTPKGNISTDGETLMASGHPGLIAIAEAAGYQKLLTTYYPVLQSGTERPINPRYNPILETFRTSCREPNIQNLPRKGGVRECFVPRPQCVYLFCDYDTLELRALAQVCQTLFGYSDMAVALREGKDLHLVTAAELASCSYEEACELLASGDPRMDELRRYAKALNFGVPGGMGAEKLTLFFKQHGLDIPVERSKELKGAYLTVYSEMRKYFEYCGNLINGETATRVYFVGSSHSRGDVKYTAVCNGFFQHLAAMGAKQAFYEVSKQAYTNKQSSLYGCRPVLFLHDEIGMEVPYVGKRASEAATALQTIMINIMAKWIQDVPITCAPVMMRKWYKGAKPVMVDGILVPGKPVVVEGKTKWVADIAA